ncbi:LOW QUALITY PROTEIN: hypothetical protein V1477_018893 [Vespula maculifrons]|uniref:Uncharacterized protein n=1 Tax=Vespula maculifrons TaxID=7453 RepID=A0ABD2ASS2_VESMC
MICEEVARATYCFRGILVGELALYAGHMICEEVAQVVRTEFLESRRKAGFVRGTHDMRRGGTGLNSWNLVGKQALYAGHMICEEVARATYCFRGILGGKLALYAGHMICEEVAQVVRTEFLESRRKAGFVRGTHDMRRGGTGLNSWNLVGKQALYAGHMICEEVARATYCFRGILVGELALYAGHMICEEVAQVVRTEFLESRRKAGFVRGTHDMRRGGTGS